MICNLSAATVLPHLEKCTQANWLGEKCTQELLYLTQARLQHLEMLKADIHPDSSKTFCFKLNILIAETDPVKLMSALLAGIIAKVNIFMCNPYWQQDEWKQVFSLVIPDTIFAESLVPRLAKAGHASDRIPRSQVHLRLTQVLARARRLGLPETLVLKDTPISWQATTHLSPACDCERQSKHQELISLVKTQDSYLVDNLINYNDTSAIMIPTGGTSGKIKFAIHNLSTLTASVRGFCDYFETSTINSFCILPLYHVSGLMQFFRSFLTTGKLHIMSYQVLKMAPVKLNVQDFFISLVPTQLQFLLDSQPLWLSKFQTVLLGGAPAKRSLLTQARELKIPVATTYGMTETASQIVTLKPNDFLKGNNSSGKILPHAQIKIVNDTQEVINSNQIGLIQIKADSLCLGYYPQLFSEATLITDDLGWLDSQGYLHIIGRNSHTIITGGEKVFPTEVEAAILATKLVVEVCVIGISDRHWGQKVTALYVPQKPGLNSKLIKQQLQAKISKYKHPKYWIEVDRIPHSDRGKIDYQQVNSIAQNWLKQQAK